MPFTARVRATAAVGIAAMTLIPAIPTHAAVEGSVSQLTTSPEGESVQRAWPTISNDGRYVAYESTRAGAGDDNGNPDVFLLDTTTGDELLISRSPEGAVGNDASYQPRISANGKFIAYASRATNLTPDSAGGGTYPLVFRYRIATNTTTLVSKSPSGVIATSDSMAPSISASGRYITYTSYAHNIVPGDHNKRADVFRYDAALDENTLVSQTISGDAPNRNSGPSFISPNGRYIAYATGAQNMGPSDTNGSVDTYLYDVSTDSTVLASHGAAGNAVGKTGPTGVSDKGPIVTLSSSSPRLATNDTDGDYDQFVYRAPSDSVALVSTGDFYGFGSGVSADGRYVVYEGQTIATGAEPKLYLLDRRTNERATISAGAAGGSAGMIAGNGALIVFSSIAENGSRELFLWTRTAG